MRIAINGMGRIGRLLFRRLIEFEQFEIVAINDLMPVKNLAYLLKYDSVYGTYPHEIKAGEQVLKLDEKEIKSFKMLILCNCPGKN